MTDDLDDLLQPTVSAERQARERPWRVSSQFWVAFLGGIVSVTAIALINARRLGIDRGKRWLMVAAAAVALAIVFVFWMRHPQAATFGAFYLGARSVRMITRVAAVGLFLVLAAIQKPHEARYLVFSGGEQASLWGAGLAAVLIGGADSPLLAWIAWMVRQ